MKTEQTNIEWADYTFNPWRGCTKVSEGCAHCYAETLSKRNPAVLGEWGKGKPRVLASKAMWQSPLKWNEEAGKAEQWAANERPRVFCASLADWLDDEVPLLWLERLLQVIRATPNLDWLLLTKRPQNWDMRLCCVFGLTQDATLRQWIEAWRAGDAPLNIWIGTSVENQSAADERIPVLLRIPARIRFLSCEPLLGPVNIDVGFRYFGDGNHIVQLCCGRSDCDCSQFQKAIHWVIAGGESGPKARPMHPDWVRSLRDQCAAVKVPFLFKQWGEWLPGCQYQPGDKERLTEQAQHSFSLDDHSWWVGKKNAGRQLDGRTHDDFPPSITGLPKGDHRQDNTSTIMDPKAPKLIKRKPVWRSLVPF